MTPSPEKNASALGAMKLGVDSLIGFLGFASLVSYLLGFYIVAPDLMARGSGQATLLRLASALSMAAAFLAIYLGAHALAKGKCRVLAGVAALGVVALTVALWVPALPAQAALALDCIAAVGVAALSTLWFAFVHGQPHRTVLVFVSLGSAVGLFGCLVEGFMVDAAVRAMAVLTGGVSWLGMAVLMKTRPDAVLPAVVGNRESDKRSKILWTSAVMLAMNSFEWGFVLACAPDASTRALCVGVGMATAALLATDFSCKRRVTERSVSPFTPPLTTLCFASLFLFGNVVQVVALCLLAAIATTYSIFGLAALAEHARMSRLSLPRTFAKARLLDYLGLLAGLSCGFGVSALAGEGFAPAVQASVAIAMAYCFLASFCHKARFPEEGMVDDDGRASLPEAKGLWKRRCRAVSEQCGLSERQYEVLMLVSQGRNAKYIEQALTISLSTAQTHIRNIYRKTGVHSRQELLDLIESTKLYGEE